MRAQLRPSAPRGMPLRCSTDGTGTFAFEGAAGFNDGNIKEPVYR